MTTVTHPAQLSRSRAALVFAAVALGAAACGSSEASQTSVADDEPVEAAEVDISVAASTTEPQPAAEEAPAASAPVPEASPPQVAACSVEVPDGMRALSLPTFGGVCTQIPDDVLTSTEGDYVGFSEVDTENVVVVARVSIGGSNVRIATVDDLVEDLRTVLQATVTETAATRTLLGADLVLYEVRDAVTPEGPGLLGKQPPGFGSNLPWSPAPSADLYLGAVDGGVMAVGVVGPDPEGLAGSQDLFDRVVDGLTLTTADGEIQPLPTLADIIGPLGEPKPFTPSVEPDGPPQLPDAFNPVDPGRYQMPNIGLVAEVEVGDGWFLAPNFPGIVVIVDGPPAGPGARDIQFLPDTNAITGVSVGPTVNTEAEFIDDLDVLLEAPPQNLVVSNVIRDTDIGGRTVTRFDVHVDPAASCGPGDPCSFALGSSISGIAKFLIPGAVHRIWWVEDDEFGALTVGASTAQADAAWLDTRATPLVETLVFV